MSVLPCLKHTINDNQHLFKISLQIWYKYLLVLLTINQPGTFFHILFEYILLIPSLVLFSCAILLYLMVVRFTTTCAISSYHHESEFASHSWWGVLETTLCLQCSR
jgi:hypothetical protein